MKPSLALTIAIALGALGIGGPADAETATAKASFLDGKGAPIGSATLTETPHGVLIRIAIEGLPPGWHGFHIHETGQCDPQGGFESAGEHFDPKGQKHGFLLADGPHAGDLPNQFVGENGWIQAELLATEVTLGDGEAALFDSDGAALIVHAHADDYQSEGSGHAGDRLACAVIDAS